MGNRQWALLASHSCTPKYMATIFGNQMKGVKQKILKNTGSAILLVTAKTIAIMYPLLLTKKVNSRQGTYQYTCLTFAA
jgi:hypothetical protein